MVIVVVRWYIKKGKESHFKKTWINDMEPKLKQGLFREFFSQPVDEPNEKYHTLDFESIHYTTFINVGIWENIQAFDLAIGSFIPDRSKHTEKLNKELIEVFDFEFKLRERIVMNVSDDRIGNWSLRDPTVENKFS